MNDDGTTTPTKRQLLFGCGGIFAAVFVLWLLIGLRSVDAGHIGVVKTGGSVTGTADPGWTHVFWPIQSLDDITLQVQKNQFAEIDAASQELQSVKLTGTITYHITPDQAVNLYKHVGVTDLEATILQPALQDYVKEVTPSYPATQILDHRGEIRDHALRSLNEKLRQNYPGLVVDDIFIANVGFSDAYSKAIEDKQVAAQQVQTAQQQQDKAKIDAQTAVITAQGEAQANAVKQASLTIELIQYLATQKWDGKLPTVTGGAVPFLNLPGK